MTPQFRRGFQPTRTSHWRVRYELVDLDRADELWKRLVQAPGPVLEGSDKIAEHLGVSTSTAARYRRVWDGLDLTIDIPGYHKEYHSYLEPLSWDPMACALATKDVRSMLVCSHRTAGASANPGSVARFARWAASAMVWKAQSEAERHEWVALRSHLCHLGEWITTKEVPIRPDDTNSDHLGEYVAIAPPPVLVIERREPPTLSTERSEETDQDSVTYQKAVTVADVMARWTCSRKTAYRRLEEWIDQGRAERVGRGKYLVRTDIW